MASSSLHFLYQQPSFGNLARKSPPRPMLQTGSFACWIVLTTVLPESLLKITKYITKLFSPSWSTGITFYIAYPHISQPFFKPWLEKTSLPSLILLLKSSGNCSHLLDQSLRRIFFHMLVFHGSLGPFPPMHYNGETAPDHGSTAPSAVWTSFLHSQKDQNLQNPKQWCQNNHTRKTS